jgi:glutamine amidotransferase
MGWNAVAWRGDWRPAADGEHFYFVHAYHARPSDASVIAATADYGGPFCAAVRRGSLFATQFHPEKSQAAGLAVLADWLSRT